MRVIIKFVNDRNGEIVTRLENTLIFSLGTDYSYKVVKKGSKYILFKMVSDGGRYIKVSPDIERGTQAEIVYFLNSCRN